MAKEEESWFTKWLRNGRLSALTFLLVFITWVCFQVMKLPAPILDQLLLTISGVLVGNLALKKQSDDDRVEKRVKNLEKEVHQDDDE